MNRRVTVTYDLPEEVCVVLERQAATEGRSWEEVVAEHVARCQSSKRPALSPEEFRQRVAAFERHFGAIDSGDPNSANNERIDADLAREYGRHDSRGE
jgi:hypothetical protein